MKFPVGTFFSSFTYEALINVDYFLDNNTIMGTEGVMILRIGDAGGGITPKDYLKYWKTELPCNETVVNKSLVSCSVDL